MTLSGKENNLHACARCGTMIVGQVALDDEEYGAIDSPVWETAYNATDPDGEVAGWVGFADAKNYYICPNCRAVEEKEDIKAEENLREKYDGD